MNTVVHLAYLAFWYCCDFMANLGNRTHSSYYEANAWVLLVLLPGLLTLLIGVRIAQGFQLRSLRHRGRAALQGRQ